MNYPRNLAGEWVSFGHDTMSKVKKIFDMYLAGYKLVYLEGIDKKISP